MKKQCNLQSPSGSFCKSTAKYICKKCGKMVCPAHYGVGYKMCDPCTQQAKEVAGFTPRVLGSYK